MISPCYCGNTFNTFGMHQQSSSILSVPHGLFSCIPIILISTSWSLLPLLLGFLLSSSYMTKLYFQSLSLSNLGHIIPYSFLRHLIDPFHDWSYQHLDFLDDCYFFPELMQVRYESLQILHQLGLDPNMFLTHPTVRVTQFILGCSKPLTRFLGSIHSSFTHRPFSIGTIHMSRNLT